MSGNELKETNKNLIPQNNNHQTKCERKNCKSIPIHLLKILFINKKGWFCDPCKQYLQNNDLIDNTNHSILEIGGETEFGKE